MILAANIGDLNISQGFSQNINSNSQTPALSVQNYIGVLACIFNYGNGASGTNLQFNFATSSDTNYSNAVAVNSNFGTTVTNITNVNGQTIATIDTRTLKSNLFINWLISGSASANTFCDSTIVAQAKYRAK